MIKRTFLIVLALLSSILAYPDLLYCGQNVQDTVIMGTPTVLSDYFTITILKNEVPMICGEGTFDPKKDKLTVKHNLRDFAGQSMINVAGASFVKHNGRCDNRMFHGPGVSFEQKDTLLGDFKGSAVGVYGAFASGFNTVEYTPTCVVYSSPMKQDL